LKNVIEPIFEAEFYDSSFGYRPGKSAKQAIEQIETVRDEGRAWVVDADIKAFFDTVNHEKLIDAVAERISDGRVLRLIRAFLEANGTRAGTGEECHWNAAGRCHISTFSQYISALLR